MQGALPEVCRLGRGLETTSTKVGWRAMATEARRLGRSQRALDPELGCMNLTASKTQARLCLGPPWPLEGREPRPTLGLLYQRLGAGGRGEGAFLTPHPQLGQRVQRLLVTLSVALLALGCAGGLLPG